jgi:hypothetical protein
MSERLSEFLTRLKAQKKPQPSDRIVPIQKCAQMSANGLQEIVIATIHPSRFSAFLCDDLH